MQAGDVFTEENVRSIRPGYGLHTRFLKEVLGRKAGTFLTKGTPISWEFIN
jgi:sialic acid synthase SpsE